MTLYTDLYPPAAVLIARKFFLESGAFNQVAPAGARYVRAMALGAGGYSTESYGGGGAYAMAGFAIGEAETIKVQVGTVSTGGVLGNSMVSRLDDTILVLADRGRGTGPAGQASNRIGTIRRSGLPGVNSGGSAGGGDSGSDAGDFGELGFQGKGAKPGVAIAAGPGGGGQLRSAYNGDGVPDGYYGYQAGPGLVCLEFFNRNPGY